jgi:hypothetical protein
VGGTEKELEDILRELSLSVYPLGQHWKIAVLNNLLSASCFYCFETTCKALQSPGR